MPEVNTAPKAKPVKPAMPALEAPKFEMPKFEIPKFDMPSMEIPAAFREFAEKGISQAKEGYEKMKSAAEEATDLMEKTYATASKGTSDYGLKVIESARANTNAALDLVGQLMTAKSYSEVVELSTGYLRSQFDTVTAQAKDLAARIAGGAGDGDREGHGSTLEVGAVAAMSVNRGGDARMPDRRRVTRSPRLGVRPDVDARQRCSRRAPRCHERSTTFRESIRPGRTGANPPPATAPTGERNAAQRLLSACPPFGGQGPHAR